MVNKQKMQCGLKGTKATTNILNISKLTNLQENHLITKSTQCLSHSPSCAYSHRTGFVMFKFTQLLFLADHDIVYCALTVVHILLECQQYNSVRQKYYCCYCCHCLSQINIFFFSVTSLNGLFDTVNSDDILSFLRDNRLYSSI